VNQQIFCSLNEPTWQRTDTLVGALEAGKAPDATELPRLFRQVSKDLALARSRGFDSALVERLNALALRTHQLMYRTQRGSVARFAGFWLRTFPRTVRREWKAMSIALALFYGGGLICCAIVLLWPDMAYQLMSPYEIDQMQQMYDPKTDIAGRPGGAESDFAMFGFYIYNNVGIAFKTFAGGMALGVGSLFFVAFNGVVLGVVSGHLINVGSANVFFPFVIGHGAPELTAIVISGAAGFRLGWALVAPGRLRRAEALRVAARDVLPLVYGAAGLLVIAAYLEGFWSASRAPKMVKYAVGAGSWLSVASYLLFAGRRGEGARRAA
jgi:uncharacterized membrane protein SpoIIM required for sporulation